MHKILITLLLCLSLSHTYASQESLDTIKLTHDNFVTIRGPINGQSASRVINDLLSNEQQEIYVFINSGGGSVVSGGEIIQTIKALQSAGKTINCIANTAMSMAFAILESCSNRYVLPSSVIMQHQMSIHVENNLLNMNSYMRFVQAMSDDLDAHQAKRMDMSLQAFRELCQHDIWMYGNEAITYKAADKVVLVSCGFIPKSVDEVVHTIFGEVTIQFSTCPLSGNPLKISFATTPNTKEDKDKALNEIELMFSTEKIINSRNNKLKTY
jgi:ATP-dependent Clp protease protease subunit